MWDAWAWSAESVDHSSFEQILTDYGDLVKAGCKSVAVFAGVKGEDRWYECGDIAAKVWTHVRLLAGVVLLVTFAGISEASRKDLHEFVY
jgi:hypothetical protein